MKKSFFIALLLIFNCIFVAAENIPSKLLGIWESKDRYIFFEQNDENEPELVVILKEYYGWYLDRAAEPVEYSDKEPRNRNISTPKNAEHIIIQNINITETSNSLYGELELSYSTWQKNIIPFLLLNDSIYLKYFVLDESDLFKGDGNFYRGVAFSKGFMISPQVLPKDITGYIIDNNKLYDVRYWQTDMDFSTEYINFTYKEDTYQIPKHIRSCNTNYSCVSGRSKKVRNTVKPFEYVADNYLFNDDAKVFTYNEEPYLKRLADSSTFEDLMNIIKEANSRRKPDPPALFPESNLDWHWDLIDMLEKDNSIIQKVRERQRAFGPRAKDSLK